MFAVVSGGSGSGKSEYAENLLLSLDRQDGKDPEKNGRYYIATMYPFDEESHARIRRHRRMRKDKGFETLEVYVSLANAEIPEGASVLLECMSNLAANEMYREDGAGKNTVSAVMEGIRFLKQRAGNLVVVTNEVFSDGACYDPSTMEYIGILGRINQEMAKQADAFIQVVYSIPIMIKGKSDV